jgi:hypothetical protein
MKRRRIACMIAIARLSTPASAQTTFIDAIAKRTYASDFDTKFIDKTEAGLKSRPLH